MANLVLCSALIKAVFVQTQWLNFISSLWTSLYHTAFYKKRTALVWPFWLFSYIYFHIGKQLLTDLLFQLPKESQSPLILCLHTCVIIYYSFPKTRRNNSVPLVITRLNCEHCCTYQHIDLNQKIHIQVQKCLSCDQTNKTKQNKTNKTNSYAAFAPTGFFQLPGGGGDAAFCWGEGGSLPRL